MLVVAPVLAIGSTFLVAGSASASTSPKNIKPTINLCKAVAGSFHFSVNGKTISFSKACVAVTGKVGVNHVTETYAPATYRNLKSISVSPNSARVSTSVHTATATVKLAAHGAATVKFTNARVVTEVVGKSGALQTGTGSIEVCKWATDNWVVGDFPFTVTSDGTSTNVSVPVDQCSNPVPVSAGTVTVTEANEFPYAVDGATTTQGTLPIDSINAAPGGGATFTVNPNQALTVTIDNGTILSYYKACKILTSNQGSLAGSDFTFDSTWVFSPPTAPGTTFTNASFGGANPVVQTLTAQSAGTESCSWFSGAPAGSVVTMNEVAFPNVVVTGVPTIQGNDSSNTSSGTTAVFGLAVGTHAGETVDAVFSNEPMGWIEVCKTFNNDDGYVYNGLNAAQFSVNGGAWFWVDGGACSAPIEVPAGTASVTEMVNGTFYLSNVSTESASDPFGTDLLSSDSPPANPAVVSVPYGGVGNETVVTFTNSVDQTQFKICKQETSADAYLAGDWFTFDYSFSDAGNGYAGIAGSGSVSLQIAPITMANPTGLVCSGMISGPPAVDPSGNSIPVAVAEESTSIADVIVTSIGYQGNGSVLYDGAPADVTGSPVAFCFDPVNTVTGVVSPINVVTFTNGRTDGAVG